MPPLNEKSVSGMISKRGAISMNTSIGVFRGTQTNPTSNLNPNLALASSTNLNRAPGP